MIRKNVGKVIIISTNLIITRSTFPPKYPASDPRIIPITSARPAAINPTDKETLEP